MRSLIMNFEEKKPQARHEVTIATAPPLPRSVTTAAGAVNPALSSVDDSPPRYGKLGSIYGATAARPMTVDMVIGTANHAMPPIK